ncbi:MAG: ATP-binding protein [Bacteroidota bacterium]
MTFKHFYLSIILRFSAIILSSGLSAWLFFTKENYMLGALSILLIVFFVVETIKYFNKINQWITFFLLGIENEDSTLKIPKNTGNKSIDDVLGGMDRLNNIFKQNKNAINTQEHYFKSVINKSATGLFSVNEDGRIVNINPKAEKLTSLAPYHHINSLDKMDSTLPKFIVNSEENRRSSSAIYENQRGQKLNFKVSDIVINDEHIKLVAVSDITRELDNGEVDAWIKLARTLSHEIMNNIAPITSLSSVIGNYFKADGKPIDSSSLNQKTINNAVKGLEVIEERSAGLMNFVENYRKFTKLPKPVFSKIDISNLVGKVILVSSGFENSDNVKIENRIINSVNYEIDENLLSQVLVNLLKNAIEVLNEEENSLVSEKVIEIKVHTGDNRTAISISNNGAEILPEIKEKIFVPFFTTKESGSGIGLSLSKQIMTKMGGDIVLKKNHKGWTSFWVYL